MKRFISPLMKERHDVINGHKYSIGKEYPVCVHVWLSKYDDPITLIDRHDAVYPVNGTCRHYEEFWVGGNSFSECVDKVKERIDFKHHISVGNRYNLIDVMSDAIETTYVISKKHEGWFTSEGGG